MKNVKLFSILIIALIIIFIIYAVRFILITGKNEGGKTVEENSVVEVTKNHLSETGTMPTPKPILDANEIANLTIDYNCKTPIKAIINNELGYEKYYIDMIQSIEQISKEDAEFPFYHKKGYYISKAPIYHFDAIKNTISNNVQIVLFSKDLKKQALYIFFISDRNKEILSQINGSFEDINKLKSSPDEKYIFIYNNSDLILDSSNTLDNYTRYTIDVKGDYYHALDYKTLGISYNKLTDKKNLVWIDLSKK